MAYSDTYASSYSTSVLVNDVDLTVTCGNTTFYPNELSEADHYNNVEVTSLSEEQLQAACKDPEQAKAIITVTSHSLSTKYQPVSIVITGDFKFESVTVTDDKTKDYKDVPSKIYNTEVIMMIVVAVIVVCAIVYCIIATKRNNKRAKEARQRFIVQPVNASNNPTNRLVLIVYYKPKNA